MSALDPIPFKVEGPQPLLREIPAGEPYPIHALGPLRAVVEAVHDITQAPVAIAAQSALAVASLAVQAFANVEALCGGGTVPCSLFCLTIAESGERKSSCDRMLMRGVLECEANLGAAYRDAFAAWEVSHGIWAGKRKRLMADATSAEQGSATSALADLRALGSEPRPPLAPNLTAQDPTFEGLLKLFETGRPALGLMSDEAGGFIGGHAMNSENRLKTIAGLSKLWDGAPVNRVRAGDGASNYFGRRLALHLMVQPIAARPLMADPQASGQGFLARFLIAEPPSAIGTRLRRGYDPASDGEVSAFASRLATILQAQMPTGDDPQVLDPPLLRLSVAAWELLQRFSEAVEAEQARGRSLEAIRSFASKSAEQAARIAGVLTLWENLNAKEVSLEVMSWAVTLAQFYLLEAKRLAEAGLVSEATGNAEALRRWLMEGWSQSEITPREMVRLGPNRLRETAVVRAAISVLEKHGWRVRLPEGTVYEGAARKEVYRIVRPFDAL